MACDGSNIYCLALAENVTQGVAQNVIASIVRQYQSTLLGLVPLPMEPSESAHIKILFILDHNLMRLLLLKSFTSDWDFNPCARA